MRIVAFDTETALILPSLKQPPIACLTWAERAGAEVKTGIEDRHGASRWLHRMLDDENVMLVGQFMQFDTVGMANEDPTLLPKLFKAYRAGRIVCTELRQKLCDLARDSYLLRSRSDKAGSYSMQGMVKRWWDVDLDKTTWRTGYGKLVHVPLRDWPQGAIDYAVQDAYWTLMIWERQQKLAAEIGILGPDGHIADEVSQSKSGFALQLMRTWGMRTDPERVASTKQRYEQGYAMMRQQLIGNKAPDGRSVLREDGSQDKKFTQELVARSYPGGKPPRTKGGAISTAGEVIEACTHPFLEHLKAYKKTEKNLKTFVPVVERGTYEPICPYFNTLVTNGRSSCSDPNLQNLPQKGGIRECFVPRAGKVFINADYDSLEARTFAQVLVDMQIGTTLVNAYRNNPDFDPHARLASQILGISEQEGLARKDSSDDAIKAAFKEVRQRSKVANFGYPGGMGAKTFIDYAKGYGLKVTVEEAEHLKTYWKKSIPEVNKYFAWVSRQTRQGKARIVQLRSGRWRGGCGFTDLANTMWSGLAADGVKEATFDVMEACYCKPESPLYGCRMVTVIHDELMGEAEPAQAHDAATELSRLMVEAMERYTPDTPIRASPQLMRRWYKGAEPAFDTHGRLIPWEPS